MSFKFFDFYSYRNYGFLFSIIFTVVTIVGYFYNGLNLGIDFKGGIIIELTTNVPDKIKDTLSAKYNDLILHQSDKNLIIRLHNAENSNIKITDQIKSEILKIDGEANFLKIDFVGPKISDDLVKKALSAFFWALFVVMVYILVRFNWRFSVGAILSLIHDLTASIGFFVVTGYEFNLTSIAAILTIIGYSVNDSVVIYDRIRENASGNKQSYLTAKVINKSINDTLSRTIMTFLTTFVACIALWVFGGENLRSFSAVITFGIAFGTYSSIFISANILPYLAKR
jgi:preprotein translocase subunit SecF